MPPKPYQAKRQAKAKRRRGSSTPGATSPQSASPEAGYARTKAEVDGKVSLGGGRSEVRRLWAFLSRDEQAAVLDIDIDELTSCLLGQNLLPGMVPPGIIEELEIAISDPDFMTALRYLFVSGVQGEACGEDAIEVPPELPPAAFAFLRIFDRHLIAAHSRHDTSARLVLFVVLALFATSAVGPFVKCIAFAGLLGCYGWLKTQDYPTVMSPETFRVVWGGSEDRADVMMTNLLLYSLCYWSPHSALVKWLSVAPAVLLLVQESVPSERGALRFLYMAAAIGIKLILLYFAWYSSLLFLATCFLLMPTLAGVASMLVLFVTNVVLAAQDALIAFIAPLQRFTGQNALVYVVFPGVVFYAWFFSSYVGAALAVLITPRHLRNLLHFVLGRLAPSLIETVSPIFLLNALPLFSYVIVKVAVAFLCAKYADWKLPRRRSPL